MSALGTSIRQAIMTSMNRQIVLVAPSHQGEILELIQQNRVVKGTGFDKDDKQQMASYYGGDTDDYDYGRSYLYSGGIAYIPIYGLLLNRVSYSGYGVTGYDYIRGAFNDALAAPDVDGIVFDINSGGGSVAGNFELADYIAENRDEKPLMALVNSISASGAYSLASAIGNIVVTPSADIGSIGVYSMHMDISKALENFGVKIQFIYAGDHKVDGNMFEPLPDDVRADIQAGVDESYSEFTQLVANHRGMDVQAVIDTQARVFSANDALRLGLIDAIEPVNVALANFQNELSGSASTNPGVRTMAKTTNPAGNNVSTDTNDNNEQVNTVDVAAKQREAVAADRQRRKDITSCAEAKNRSKLAAHLADNTDLSVDDAKAMLGAAAEEQVAAPGNGGAAFNKAMTSTDNPGLGNDDAAGEQAGDTVKEDRTARILAASKKAGSLRLVSKK